MNLSRRSLVIALALTPAVRAHAQIVPMTSAKAMTRQFDFRPGTPAVGFQSVTSTTFFSAANGFGFEPVSPEAAVLGPRLFSVSVPEGNYRVTVELGSSTVASDTTIKAESRRLMLESVKVPRGGSVRRDFIVNVRNRSLTPPPTNAPGFDSVATNDREVGSYTWDDKLTLEFAGPAPAVRTLTIEPVEVPTVYIAGDSTVTDQRSEPGASWGQMLPRFFKPDIAIANHAESGETMKSFITGRRLDKMLSTMKAGDFLIMQFGHNDSKASWPQTYVEAQTTYRDYMKVFIGEARRRGATPIVVTPPQRRNFDAAGKITNSHGAYPDAVRAVAQETGAPLIDLTAMSIAFYEALGPAESPKAFSNGGRDVTHHNNYGAYQLARGVVEGIRASAPSLAAHLAGDAGRFDPRQPPAPDAFVMAPSASRSNQTPRGS